MRTPTSSPSAVRPGSPGLGAALICLGAALALAGCRCGERRRAPAGRRAVITPDAMPLGDPPVEVDTPDAGLRLPVVLEKEPNNWPEYAQKIHPGIAIRGTIGYPLTKKMGDRDVYCFTVGGKERQVMRATVTGVPRLRLQLTVRTARFVTVKTVRSPALGRELIISNLTLSPGAYCFVVSEARAGPPFHFSRKKSYILTYSLRPVVAQEERESNDKFYEANTLRPGVEVRGLVGRVGDEDWYRVPLTGLPATSLLSLTFVGVGGVTADVTVYDFARRKILSRRGTRGATVYIRDLKVRLATGLVYVRVSGQRRFSPDDYYRLKVEASQRVTDREVEPNDTPNRAVRIHGKRGQVQGSIEVAHDVDYYHLPLSGRSNVRLKLEPPAGLDLKLTAYSMRGRRIAEADFGKAGETELLTNVRASAGIRVRVAGSKRSFDPLRSYRLRWAVTPADRGDEREPNDTLATPNTIVPGVTARGFIYPRGDVDVYRFRLPGFLGTTQKVTISVQGVPRVRLELTLMDGQKNVLARSARATTEGMRKIVTTLHSAKYYYLRVRDEHDRRVNATDHYELMLGRSRR